MQIRDWSAAQEFDIEAATYIQRELRKRELEREKRDRAFWIQTFGGEVPEELIAETDLQMDGLTEEEALALARLGRG